MIPRERMAVPDALVVDKRAQIADPGLHAVVIGVSAYECLPEREGLPSSGPRQTFGLVQLRSAATAACRFVEFLIGPPAGVVFTRPLKTCRLLLSAHSDEAGKVAATLGKLGSARVPEANTKNVIGTCSDWRHDAEADESQALTIFYFAGHGFQIARGSNATMLVADFAPEPGGTLRNVLHLKNLENFMIGSSAAQENTPLHQYYFVDACRVEPQEFEPVAKQSAYDSSPILKELKYPPATDHRHVAHFFAAKSGTGSWGRAGLGTYFGEALRSAMTWAAVPSNEPVAGVDGFLVTPESLIKGLKHEFSALVEHEISEGRVNLNDITNENGDVDLPVGPGDVDPLTQLPLLVLDRIPDCRIRFRLVPPGRGFSQTHVDFLTGEGNGTHPVHSGPVEKSPRFWSSRLLPFNVRGWRNSEDWKARLNPAKERSGTLLRPADRVTLEISQEKRNGEA